jgi:pyrroline-5-carboxylate reductase
LKIESVNSPKKSTIDQPSLSIAFIGGGNMAAAIIGGLLKKAHVVLPENIQVVEPSASQCELLRTDFGLEQVISNHELLKPAAVVVLAVKPQVMAQVCNDLSRHPWIANTVFLTIAAGIKIQSLQHWLSTGKLLDVPIRIVRAMPNTPALVGQGISGLAASAQATAADREVATTILSAVGKTMWFENESSLDAVTAMSGSGPAYVFYLLEAFQAAGQKVGLSSEQAKQLAIETFVGASALAKTSPDSFATLREKVTSKGGTTAAALAVMKEKNLAETFEAAVKAANDRSIELGNASQ